MDNIMILFNQLKRQMNRQSDKKHAPKSHANAYPFQYSRSVQPEVNQHRHIVKGMKKHLPKQKKKMDNLPSNALLSELDKGYGMADPLCDAWIEYAVRHKLPGYGMPLFQQVLNDDKYDQFFSSCDDIPEPLQALLQQSSQLPSWYDPNKSLTACYALLRYPFQLGLVLQSMSLMGGYCVPGLAEPLLMTKSLTNNVVARIARTLCFVASVGTPQGFSYNKHNKQWEIGFKQTLNTRVVHGLVRHKLLNNAYNQPWNHKKYGVPINQSDMIATNMSFSLTVVHGLVALGCKLSLEEREAILHLWRYVSHIIGIDDELMPKTEQECNEWAYGYFATQAFEPKPAKPLAIALHELPVLIETSKFKGLAKLEQQLRAGVTRSYWGDDICDGLGLPNPQFAKTGVVGIAKLQWMIEQLQKVSSRTEEIMIKSAENYRGHVQEKYLASNPELKPLFDEILDLVARAA